MAQCPSKTGTGLVPEDNAINPALSSWPDGRLQVRAYTRHWSDWHPRQAPAVVLAGGRAGHGRRKSLATGLCYFSLAGRGPLRSGAPAGQIPGTGLRRVPGPVPVRPGCAGTTPAPRRSRSLHAQRTGRHPVPAVCKGPKCNAARETDSWPCLGLVLGWGSASPTRAFRPSSVPWKGGGCAQRENTNQCEPHQGIPAVSGAVERWRLCSERQHRARFLREGRFN